MFGWLIDEGDDISTLFDREHDTTHHPYESSRMSDGSIINYLRGFVVFWLGDGLLLASW